MPSPRGQARLGRGAAAGPGWGHRYGPWWAFQWARDIGPVNLGIHAELRTRETVSGTLYGPYLDLHLPWCVLSVGRHPVYLSEFQLSRPYSRGGLHADHDESR